MKKAFLLFCLLTGLWSCFCDDILPYWEITDLQVTALDRNYQVAANGTIDTDTLILYLQFDAVFLSTTNTLSPTAFFTNKLLAIDCEDPGWAGLKDPLVAIEVSSNRDLNEVPAGASLNELVLVNGRRPIEDIVEWSDMPYAYRGLEFWLTQRPDEVDWRTFTVSMEFASGKVLKGDSETVVRW